MQALQNRDLLSSDTNAMDQLHAFLRQRCEAHVPVENLDAFEQELHRLFVTAEREALSQELSRFDLDVPVVEVDGERYHRVLRYETTYASAAGPVRVEQSLYRSSQGGPTLRPLERRARSKACGHASRAPSRRATHWMNASKASHACRTKRQRPKLPQRSWPNSC